MGLVWVGGQGDKCPKVSKKVDNVGHVLPTTNWNGMTFGKNDSEGIISGPNFQYRQTRHLPRAAALQGRHSHQEKKEGEDVGKQTLLIYSISIISLLQYRLIWYQNDGNFYK